MRSRSRPLLALALAGLLAAAAAFGGSAPGAPVADAAMRGDLDAVKSLLATGADPSAAQGDGMTGLHWAALQNRDDLVALLAKAGAQVAAKTRIGAYTPLHVAAREGAARAVEALLDAGADPNAPSDAGVAPLHLAAMAGDAEAIAALIGKGARVDEREPAFGRTPLMLAAAEGRTAAVKVLIAKGARVGALAKDVNLVQRAAEDAAARRARARVLDARRDSSANPVTWRPTPVDVADAVHAARTVEGEKASTAGVEAANAGYQGGNGESNPGFAAMVIVQGGLSPLLLAVRGGHVETVDALLDAGADVNQARLADGTSPILEAAINGHWDLVIHLVERGADVNKVSVQGAAPLYAVINKQWAPRSRMPQPTFQQQQEHDYLQVMEALLKAGADPDARLASSLWYTTYDRDNIGMDYTGATPFWRAAYGTDREAMELLLRYGADPGLPTIRRQRGGAASLRAATPAIVAAAGAQYGRGFAANDHEHKADGWMPTMRLLVERVGADVNAADADGYTALHYAAARGDNEMIRYLVERGADVTAVARNGQTTADMANGPVQRYSPFAETVELLERLGARNNHRCVSC